MDNASLIYTLTKGMDICFYQQTDNCGNGHAGIHRNSLPNVNIYNT